MPKSEKCQFSKLILNLKQENVKILVWSDHKNKSLLKKDTFQLL